MTNPTTIHREQFPQGLAMAIVDQAPSETWTVEEEENYSLLLSHFSQATFIYPPL